MRDITMLKLQIAAIMFGSAIALTIIIVGHFDRHPAAPIVEVPACDTNANGADAVEQLAARMKAGVASTDCDLQQLDHVASLASTCEVELHMDRVNRMHCESELHDCESAPMDLERLCDHREPSRLEAAIDAIYVLNGMLPPADRFDLCQPCGGAFWGRPGLGVCLGLDFSQRRCSTCGTIRPEPEPATPRVR